jgi:DNA-binding PadR family transcriptional regulator
MTKSEEKARRFLPLTEATFCILAALAQPRHGYGIMQRVEEASRGRIRLGPGTLYGALTNLQKQALAARTEDVEASGERRKLYVLTALGREVVELECRRLVELVVVGRELLGLKGELDGR